MARGRPVRTAALFAALFALLLAGMPAAHADEAVVVDRIAGEDRFETAALVSEDAFPDPDAVSTVYVATGQEFPDALTAGGAAATDGGPVLLVRRASVPEPTRDELRRLQPEELVIVGGELAVSAEVEAELADDDEIGAEVRRIEGENRFDTAAELARDSFPDGADTVFIATGLAFPDALAGVPAASRFDAPLLLVASASIPPQTLRALEALDPSEAVILGGPGAIRPEVEQELRDLVGETSRREGESRYETAVEVARRSFLGARTVYVATGINFPDALGGGPAAAERVGPLLLTPGSSLPDVVASELRSMNPRRVVVLGGTQAIRETVVEQIREALEGATSLPDGTVPDFAFTAARAAPGQGQLQSVWIGTLDGALEEFSNPPTEVFDVAQEFSPDGRRVAFVRADRDDSFADEIYVGNVADGVASLRRITDNEADFGGCGIGGLSWGPESNTVVFTCFPRPPAQDEEAEQSVFAGHATNRFFDEHDEPRPSRVIVVGVDGSTIVIDPEDDIVEDRGGVFTPDGERVVLERYDPEAGGVGNVQLRSIPLDDPTSAGELLHDRNGGLIRDITFAPDGETIGFAERAGIFDGWISILEPDDGEPTRVLDGEEGEVNASGEHVLEGFSPDGDRVLVRSVNEPNPDDSDDSQTIVRLVTIANDTEQDMAVGHGDLESSTINQARLSPDGALVIYDDMTSIGTDGLIRIVAADGSDRRTVEAGEVSAGVPSWNPLAFAEAD